MSPQLVQEALPSTARLGQEQFAFVACQQGTEPMLKAKWLGESSPFRLAFSRPGLMTFKVVTDAFAANNQPVGTVLEPPEDDSEANSPWATAKVRRATALGPTDRPATQPGGRSATAQTATQGQAVLRLLSQVVSSQVAAELDQTVSPPNDWAIRLSGWVLGQVKGELAEPMVDEALALAGHDWDAVHVFHRDTGLPGMKGFEPGPTLVSDAIAATFAQRWPQPSSPPPINAAAEVGQRVLDIVLVEPQQWLIGHHVVQRSHERWPGGAYSAPAPAQMVSRAYLKMAEALAWSGLPIRAGDNFVEIGSSPGGACQRLLDLGLKVTGIDPAEMDPLILDHPRFEHWRAKTSGVRRKMYSKFRWLAADASVAPKYTLDCVEDIVTYKTNHIAGLLLTIKLTNYELADKMDEHLARVRGWGYAHVDVRQLASNRRECCIVAERR